MKNMKPKIKYAAIAAILASACVFALVQIPPEGSRGNAEEINCPINPNTIDWADKDIGIIVTPVDINYDTCTVIGPIVDRVETRIVNSTTNNSNNDAYSLVVVSAGHTTTNHSWFFVKNPTDYDIEVELALGADECQNIQKIIEFWLTIGNEQYLIVFDGTVQNQTVHIDLNPWEVQLVSYRLSYRIDDVTQYTAKIHMDETIKQIPSINP
jgi:hypothetical protein